MTKIITIAVHKGGSSKTASVASIGAYLAIKGFKTLLIDLDGQANLTSCFLEDNEEDRQSIYDAMIGNTSLPICSVKENLDIAPSSLEMAGAEIALTNTIAREQVLSYVLRPVASNYDYILIDCPPSLGIVTTNALLAATDIIIPLTPELLPLKGMSMMEDYVNSLKRVNPDIHITGIFISRYNNRKLNKVVESSLRERYGKLVFSTKIRENIALAESAGSRSSIFEYAADSNGAKDYASLTEEIINRIQNS